MSESDRREPANSSGESLPAEPTTEPAGGTNSIERTVEMPAKPAAVPETTQEFTPPPATKTSTPELTPEEQERRLATELSKRGVPADEVARLLALGKSEPVPAKSPVAPVAPVVSEPPKDDYVAQPTITLPVFRDATPQQKVEADRLLTTANLARRRGQYKEAEQACRQAIDLAPRDAAALELYGDVLQSVGRVDDALYAYRRAVEADAARASAERKFAELRLMQNRDIERLRLEYIPRNPYIAGLFSFLCPGAGQFYNGQSTKGLILVVITLFCVLLIGWTPLGYPGSHVGIPFTLIFLLLVAAAVDIYAVADAYLGAQAPSGPKSGWEV